MTESLLTFALKAAILAARELNVLAKGEIADGTTFSVLSSAPQNMRLSGIDSARREYERAVPSTKNVSSPASVTNSVSRPADFAAIIVRRLL